MAALDSSLDPKHMTRFLSPNSSILRRFAFPLALSAAALTACSSPQMAQAKGETSADCVAERLPAPSPANLPQEVICLKTAAKSIAITVEIASTPAEQARGLMYRTELAADKGMLFPFTIPRQASFWMKNTYIPLDIIYLTPDGAIESIAANAEPTSLEPILSKGKVGYVLELAGGRAGELGLKAGDQMVRSAP